MSAIICNFNKPHKFIVSRQQFSYSANIIEKADLDVFEKEYMTMFWTGYGDVIVQEQADFLFMVKSQLPTHYQVWPKSPFLFNSEKEARQAIKDYYNKNGEQMGGINKGREFFHFRKNIDLNGKEKIFEEQVKIEPVYPKDKNRWLRS